MTKDLINAEALEKIVEVSVDKKVGNRIEMSTLWENSKE